MAVFRNEPRPAEPTEKRIVEVTRDGKIVSSELLGGTAEPVIPPQMVPPPRVVRVKSGGKGALMLLSLVLVLALVGLGFYVYQMRDDSAAKQEAELQLQEQRSVAEQKLQELGRAANDLSDQVRDAQRDLGVPGTPPPATTTPAPPTAVPAEPATPSLP